MKEKIIDPIISKKIWIQDRITDSDFDGVPNYRDCEIFNPNRQHIFKKEPIRKKELLSMTGDISVFDSDSFYKIKKIVRKHEKKGKKRRYNGE